jgi:signal transduction histidine kinase
MPDMLGTRLLELCTQRHPDVVRVLLTGYTDNDTLIDAINAGHVYSYLTKPWEPGELRVVVRRGLERHAAAVERRRLLAELQAACARAQREAEAKGRLLALAAHEIGTPLHIAGNALEIAAEYVESKDATTWLERVRESLLWLGRVAEQMHRAGQWDGRATRCRRRFDFAERVSAVTAAYAPIAAARGLQLTARLDLESWPLDGDRAALEHALSALLSNAIRFTPDGGRIGVTAWNDEKGMHVEVADNGIGIEPSLLPEIFEPFSGAGGEIGLHRSGRFEFGARGLGLGLALAKAVVEGHGGGIEVVSEPGKGSRFRLSLPNFSNSASHVSDVVRVE